MRVLKIYPSDFENRFSKKWKILNNAEDIISDI